MPLYVPDSTSERELHNIRLNSRKRLLDAADAEIWDGSMTSTFGFAKQSVVEISISGTSSNVEVEDIELQTFCEHVTQGVRDIGISPEQISEVLGGISNLYLEIAIKAGKATLEINTFDGLASEHITPDQLLWEVGACAGTGRKHSARILASIRQTLSSYTKDGGPVHLMPLGIIEPIESTAGKFRLRFRDPAADHYHCFLI
jgi:hypothetical protein